MNTSPRARLRALAVGACLSAVLATGTLAPGPAQAAGTPVEITVISTTNTQIQVGLCISSTGTLPARLTGTYSIRHAGSVIASGDMAAAVVCGGVTAAGGAGSGVALAAGVGAGCA